MSVGDHLCPQCNTWLPIERTGGLCAGCLAIQRAPDLGRPWPEVNRLWCGLLHRGIRPPRDPRYAAAEAELDALVGERPVARPPPAPAPRWVGGWT